MGWPLHTHTLAPPFTTANASEMARRSHAPNSRRIKSRSKRAKAMLAPDDSLPVKRIKLQLDKVLTWMERVSDAEDYGPLVVMLDKLWSKAYPTQAAVKSSRSRQTVAPVAPISPINPVGDPQ